MEVRRQAIDGVLEVQPRVFEDERGWFVETFQAQRYLPWGIGPFVQDNASRSVPGTLRGLHVQHPSAQGKLVAATEGRVLDLALDVRVGSPTFGHHVAVELTAAKKNQLWIPPGFAHGFLVLGESPATLVYKCTDLYAPDHELSVSYTSVDLDWPVDAPTLSDKDLAAPRLEDIDPARLPVWSPS
ncbi:MAG: dTDP-4-dehydrorhamnose 3,5-epimerase [Sandaracinaceae bacterium]